MICPFTEKEVKTTIAQSPDGYYTCYSTSINGKDYLFRIHSGIEVASNEYFIQNKHLFKGLQLNLKWPNHWEIFIDNEDSLRKIIYAFNPPNTPKEKLENLFLYILDCQMFEGQRQNWELLFSGKSPELFYLRVGAEIDFYLSTLVSYGYLRKIGPSHIPQDIELTYEGLQFGIKLREEGIASNNCFIAMSFNENMISIREAIKSACIQNGFKPILIDEQKIDSDQTINDAIIATIKISKFCIADFTQQKNGVYFEAGYALGRGLPVIYLCSNEDFSNLHFDTNHFPQLKYDSSEHLFKLLDDRIKAWIL